MNREGVMWLALGVISCGGSSSGALNQGEGVDTSSPDGAVSPLSDGGADSATGAAADSGTVNPAACGASSPMPSTLAGTWDVQGSRASNAPSSATLVIDASHFAYTAVGGDSLSFSAQGGTLTTTWQVPGSSAVAIGTTHATASLAQGILPLGLGGQWTFAGTNPGSSALCQADIGAPTFTASCTNAPNPPWPLPYLNGSVTGTRTRTLPSLFGDLGGTWHLSSATSATSGGTCDATFAGNVLSVTCAGTGALDGTATVTFCDAIASGTTNDGVEFSAHRQ